MEVQIDPVLSEVPHSVKARSYGDYPPNKGIALCLSGGGYRALLFHLGALQRLNELGLLKEIKLVSSVSGGSIAAGFLARHWHELTFDHADGHVASNFKAVIADRVLAFAQKSVAPMWKVLVWMLTGTGSTGVRNAYDQLAHFNVELGALKLPPDAPSFRFNAIDMQTGARWYFAPQLMGDSKDSGPLGLTETSGVTLSQAVAASGAFPPFLSPFKVNVAPIAVWRDGSASSTDDSHTVELRQYLRTTVLLGDGGMFDNLGLEPAMGFYTLLVSDGGKYITHEPHLGYSITKFGMSFLIPFQILRVINLIDNQVRVRRSVGLRDAFRFRQVMVAENDVQSRFIRQGAYWRMTYEGLAARKAQHPALDLDEFADSINLADAVEPDLNQDAEKNQSSESRDANTGLEVDPGVGRELANTDTGLRALSPEITQRLINLGYARCNFKLLTYAKDLSPLPDSHAAWPFPQQALNTPTQSRDGKFYSIAIHPVVLPIWFLAVCVLLSGCGLMNLIAWSAESILGVSGLQALMYVTVWFLALAFVVGVVQVIIGIVEHRHWIAVLRSKFTQIQGAIQHKMQR